MVKKLIILGMDGLDFDVLLRYEKSLPNFSKLLKYNDYPRMKSIFPADTTPAWSSIYLGVDPTYHGIINFINTADKNNSYKGFEFNDEVFRGKCFWDILTQKGYSCGVILPMNIKEGWELKNGIMITRPFHQKINVFPNDKTSLYKPNKKLLLTEPKFTSEKKLTKTKNLLFKKANEERRLLFKVGDNENLDILFAYFSTPDGIQHDFWCYCDKDHVNYKQNNMYENTIYEIYKFMDDIVGEVQEKYPLAKILIVSDHGHGARPTKLCKINEILKREGFLFPVSTKKLNRGKTKASFKVKLFKIVRKIGLPTFVVKLLKKFPIWKKILASSDNIDWNKTTAYLSDLSAVKNYSYGGIKINGNIAEKNQICDEIIEKLKKYQIEDKPLFEWIIRTNTFYHGPFLSKYPEIIFQMNEKYGASWDLGDEVFTNESTYHLISSGGHRYKTATILTDKYVLKKKDWVLTEIKDLIFDMVLEK